VRLRKKNHFWLSVASGMRLEFGVAHSPVT
jgi:hypothetical protein